MREKASLQAKILGYVLIALGFYILGTLFRFLTLTNQINKGLGFLYYPGQFFFSNFSLGAFYIPGFLFFCAYYAIKRPFQKKSLMVLNLTILPFVTFTFLLRLVTDSVGPGFFLYPATRSIGGKLLISLILIILLALEVYFIIKVYSKDRKSPRRTARRSVFTDNGEDSFSREWDSPAFSGGEPLSRERGKSDQPTLEEGAHKREFILELNRMNRQGAAMEEKINSFPQLNIPGGETARGLSEENEEREATSSSPEEPLGPHPYLTDANISMEKKPPSLKQELALSLKEAIQKTINKGKELKKKDEREGLEEDSLTLPGPGEFRELPPPGEKALPARKKESLLRKAKREKEKALTQDRPPSRTELDGQKSRPRIAPLEFDEQEIEDVTPVWEDEEFEDSFPEEELLKKIVEEQALDPPRPLIPLEEKKSGPEEDNEDQVDLNSPPDEDFFPDEEFITPENFMEDEDFVDEGDQEEPEDLADEEAVDDLEDGDVFSKDSVDEDPAEIDEDEEWKGLEEEIQFSDEDFEDEDSHRNEVPLPVPEPPKPKPKKRYPKNYEVPVEGILNDYDNGAYWTIDDGTRQSAEILTETLKEFKISAEVTGIRKGPVITMFEILPAPGVKLSKIVNLADNIALRLAASSVRIVAPIPGKHAVGIEVPNKKRAIVSFKELVTHESFGDKKFQVPIIIGKDITGDAQIIDLVQTPHLLIAGATGSGKSVCVNSIISSILYARTPQEVKLIMIDPKIVELKFYNDIPHLLTPVITDPKKAYQALQYCLYEMERRYSLLDAIGVRDIRSFNKKIKSKKLAVEALPYMVILIDEFADLMATSGKELESTIARLAAMSRAVGIHIVLATQRPSVEVITGLIKANIPSRIAFMVAGKFDSRIIIDSVGAEKLLGKGDMLFCSGWDPNPIRMQGAYLSEEEVEAIVEHVKTLGEPEYIDEEIFLDDDENMGDFASDANDPLMDKALEIVVAQGKASASYLQRKLKIGYNRAARLVEEMEVRGIVGPANGSKPREILHVPDRS